MAGILVASALGFSFYESRTQAEEVGFFEGLWWAMVTLFTVGYGDFAPKTVPGRILGMGVMACGIGLVSTITGSLASSMVERRIQRRRGLLPVNVQGHVLIVNWNGHGPTLLERLRRMPTLSGAPVVLAADMEPGAYEALADTLDLGAALSFVRGNTASKAVLERANLTKARLAYVLGRDDVPPNEADNHSVLATLTLRSLAPGLTIYAEAMHDASREHLLRAGATKVMGREELAGRSLAFMAAHPVMQDVLHAIWRCGEQGHVHFRTFSEGEQQLTWPELVSQCLRTSGQLPVGACKLPKELRIADVLDSTRALDQFVMELFKSAGSNPELASQGPHVVLNPGPENTLEAFDGLIYLDQER